MGKLDPIFGRFISFSECESWKIQNNAGQKSLCLIDTWRCFRKNLRQVETVSVVVTIESWVNPANKSCT